MVLLLFPHIDHRFRLTVSHWYLHLILCVSTLYVHVLSRFITRTSRVARQRVNVGYSRHSLIRLKLR